MHHDTPLITTIVAGLVLAFVLGAVANRFRLPPLVGYLIAGVLVGPFTPGFVGDVELASELSEIGVILLMFGVGLHFSLKDLLSVRALAVPGAIVQIGGATVMGFGLASVVVAALFVATLFTPLVNGPLIAVLTARTPEGLRAKVMTAVIATNTLAAPVGFLLAGQVLERWGVVTLFGGVVAGITLMSMVFAAIVRRHDDGDHGPRSAARQ